MRQAQHPLTNRHVGEDMNHEMRCTFRHAAAAAPSTASALAREGDESTEAAGRAAKAREAARRTAAPEEVAKLSLHEASEALAVAQRPGLGAERLEMVLGDPVEDGGRGIARRVRGRWLRHTSSSGARRATTRNRESGLNLSGASAGALRMTTAIVPSSGRSERKRYRRPVFGVAERSAASMRLATAVTRIATTARARV